MGISESKRSEDFFVINLEEFIHMDILLKNIDIVSVDSNRFMKNRNIFIQDGYIRWIDASHESHPEIKPDKVIDGKNKIAMPGLVNTHTHSAMTLLRNFADDLALEEWLFKKIFPVESKLNPEDVYWGTMLGITEMIKTGTTSFADMYLLMDSVAQAVVDTGIRANLSKSPLKFNAGEKSRTIDETAGCFDYYKKWHNAANGRIKVYIEVHSAYLYDQESLINAAKLADELDTGIHVHILETQTEREVCLEKYGMDSAEICLQCGIFNVPVIAAHCVHLSDHDMDILREKRINVAHNPTSNLKLGSGVANVPRMIDSKINVSLGTDGAASNNNLNMFEEMHITALLHKGVHMNPELINADTAVKMATVNGANAIGFGGEVGCISEGMKADLIILDTDKPHLYPMNDPISAIVYSVQGSDVDTVIIDGNIVMENRVLKTIDEELVKHKAGEIAKKLYGRD